MTDHATPNTFTNGTEADATQVNANFAAIATFLNNTGVHVYQAATIETAALEDLAVSTAKIAAGAVTAAKVAADVATQAELDAVASAYAAADAAHVTATGAHAATKISVDSTTMAGTATDVQGSLEELDDAIAAVVSGGVAAGTITSAMILDGEIVNADINAAAEIAVSKLADGAAYDVLGTNSDGTTVAWVSGLTANHLASDAVTTAKILDANVTGPKLSSTMSGDRAWSGVNTFSGAPRQAVQTITGAATISATGGQIVFLNYTGGSSVTVTLPVAAAGMVFFVKFDDSGGGGSVSLDGNGSDLINGSGSAKTVLEARVYTLICIASGGWIMSESTLS